MKTRAQPFTRRASETAARSIGFSPSENSCHTPGVSASILLVAANARYSHSSYSLRTLKANLRELENECGLLESDLSVIPTQLAAQITECGAKIVGFSIYLWNLRLLETTARILKTIAPRIKLIAGGPELTVNYKNSAIFDLCVIGEGESVLRESCRAWLSNPEAKLPNIIETSPEKTDTLKLPFHLYTRKDIATRVIYVEASRGCPYRCGYCTSAGTGLRLIPLETLLPALDSLWRRGVRQYKFLDRSFTAAREHALTIMRFFLERAEAEMRLHFEVYTDILHPRIKEMFSRFPAGALHLECGIQTLNPAVAERIGRSADSAQTLNNLRFLTEQSGADIHADLIFGLPGEDEASFASGFNKLVNSCNPSAVQINLLKLLPGTELAKRAAYYDLEFNPEPPYELLKSDKLSFSVLNRMRRLARCWELVHNRGKCEVEAKKLIALSPDVYGTFMRLAEHIYREEGRMYKISLTRLKKRIEEFRTRDKGRGTPDTGCAARGCHG